MQKSLLSLVTLSLWMLIPAAVRADEEAEQIKSLFAKYSPAIVTIKMVLKTEMKFGGQNQESENKTESQGVVVSEDGLVMLSSLPFSTDRMREMMGRAGGDEGFEMKIRPTDFKVTFEREDKEYTAFLAATDTNLGLAFIKLEGLENRKLPVVDFSSTTTPGLAQKLYALSRLSKGYDYAPYFQSGRISGEITKPRRAWVIDGIGEIGLPVFTATGEVAGVVTTIVSGVKSESGSDVSMAMVMRMFSGGGGGLISMFVLPNTTIQAVIGQAKQRAIEVAAERAKAKTAKTTPSKPAETKKAGNSPAPKPDKPKKP